MRRAWGWLAAEAAILVAAATVKALAVAQLADHPLLQPAGGLDSEWYVALATRVAAGDWTLAGAFEGGAFPISPLYVYVLAIVLGLSNGSLVVARVVQAVLGVVAVACAMRSARDWFGDAAGLVTGALLAGAGVITFHEIVLLQSALDPMLMAALALVLGRAILGDRWRAWAGTGILAALFALNRPNALILAAGIGAGLAVRALITRTRPETLAVVAFMGALMVGLAPAALRNLAVAGRVTLVSSHGGLNFFIGNRAGADGTYEAPVGITPSIAGQAHDARVVAEAALGRPLSDPEVSGYFTDLGLAWIRQHPGEAAALFARKLWLVAHRTELPLNYSYAYYERDEPSVLRWLPIGAWCLVPLGVAGLAARPRSGLDRRAYAAWVALIPLYALSVAVFFVAGRYRLPILVPLAITGGGGLTALVVAIRAHRWIDAAIPVAAAALAAVIALWPLALDDGRLEERVAMASALASMGRPGEAVARAAIVAREHPEPGTVHYRVALALQAHGDLSSAEAEVRRALTIDPAQPEAHATLGQLLARAGRIGEARHHMLRATTGGASAAGAARWILDDAVGGPETSSAVFAVSEVARIAAVDAGTLRDLGQHLLEARRGDLAEPYYLALDARHPRHADIVEALGVALLERGRAARAARTLERAVGLDGTRPSSHLHLAIAYVQIDRPADALAEARRALALRPDYPQARGVVEALGRMGR
ncbi:MAG: glycosyltransferase family 39 protein [Vicinamibacteraceae bacterium]